MEQNQIISLSGHCLHLCNNSNVEEIVFTHIMEADVFVTNNSEYWAAKFGERGITIPIKKPSVVKLGKSIVVDSSSLNGDFEKWEKIWEKQNQAVCIYNIDKLKQPILKQLVEIHDKLLLSINKIRMLSDKALEKEIGASNPEVIENLVKRELKNIVLSLILTKPLCGTDLTKLIYQKFKVFISPGMLYPALHELEKDGLLKYEYKLKNKIYHIQENGRAENLLTEHANANALLSELLRGAQK